MLNRTNCPKYNAFMDSLNGILDPAYTFDTAKSFITNLGSQVSAELSALDNYRNVETNNASILQDLKSYDALRTGGTNPQIQDAEIADVVGLITGPLVPLDVDLMSAALYEAAVLNYKLNQRERKLKSIRQSIDRMNQQLNQMKSRYN